MTPTNSNTTAHLATFLTILCWGTTFVSTKVLLQGFTPVQILLIRFSRLWQLILAFSI